jgi:hypothetical protein
MLVATLTTGAIIALHPVGVADTLHTAEQAGVRVGGIARLVECSRPTACSPMAPMPANILK